MQEQTKSNSTSWVVAAMVGGLILGGVIGMMAKKTPKVEPSSSTKATELRVLLNSGLAEHVSLASTATRNGFDGDPAFKASGESLDANSLAIAAAVGSVYGKDAEAQFLEIWRSHIGFFVDYTVAAKGGDTAGMKKAVDNLGGYVEAISTFFSNANPNLPKMAVAELVNEHVGLLKGAVDAHGAGDFAKSFDQQHQASVQIGTIAGAISGAIVKQSPDNFR